MQVQPYLSFDGHADEAIEFYKGAVGAKVNMLMRFKDSPEPPPSGQFPPEMMNKVLHASLTIGESIVLLSDGRCMDKMKFHGICLTLLVSSEAEAERVFGALSNGGKITMPLAKTFFSPRFGMLDDRFGVSWMVYVES
jgi:PhnB protein